MSDRFSLAAAEPGGNPVLPLACVRHGASSYTDFSVGLEPWSNQKEVPDLRIHNYFGPNWGRRNNKGQRMLNHVLTVLAALAFLSGGAQALPSAPMRSSKETATLRLRGGSLVESGRLTESTRTLCDLTATVGILHVGGMK